MEIINSVIGLGENPTENKSAEDLLNALNQRLNDTHLKNASGLAAHIKYFINEKMKNKRIEYPVETPAAEDSTKTMDGNTRCLSLR